MGTFEEILNLCEEEQGKVFVVNTKGDVQCVVLGVEEYKKLKQQEPRAKKPDADPDTVNKKIVQAQLAEELIRGGVSASAVEDAPIQRGQSNPYPVTPPPQIMSNGLPKQRDMREEVIDPSFDFDAPEEI